MAERAEPTPPPAPVPSRRKLWIIVGASAALLLTGGAAAAYFSGMLTSGSGDADAEHQAEAVKPRPEALYVPIEPPFTVNLQAGSSSRYLQTTVELLTREPSVEAAIKRHLPVIRDHLVMLFSRKDAQDLATPDGREHLRGDALAAVQGFLEAETGTKGVEQVLFTSFVMQ